MDGRSVNALELERRTRAGCRQLRKARSTGTVVGIYRADEAGLDDGEGEEPYSTICEEHSFVVSHRTLELARWHASSPEDWCEPCRDGVGPNYRWGDGAGRFVDEP